MRHSCLGCLILAELLLDWLVWCWHARAAVACRPSGVVAYVCYRPLRDLLLWMVVHLALLGLKVVDFNLVC